MRRRDFLAGSTAALLVQPGAALKSSAQPILVPKAKADRQAALAALRRDLIDSFPYPLREVAGEDALASWRAARNDRQTTPIILADEDSLMSVLDNLPSNGGEGRAVPTILAEARALTFPQDLRQHERKQEERFAAIVASWPKERREQYEEQLERFRAGREQAKDAPRGSFPEIAEEEGLVGPVGLTVVLDLLSGRFLDEVHLATLPTADPTEVPAYLFFGGWNACPPPEHHVAALRGWHERYGAVPVGLNHGTMNVLVERRPSSRDEAVELALDQYAYCPDVVEQGAGTIENLAATLMVSDWWYFWWD